MSAFTEQEVFYLRENKLGRLATAGADGQPHVIPVTYFFNGDEDTIDVGGLNFGAGKKWRDVEQNPKVAFLVDDVIGPPRRARAIEVRGDAELHETGGEAITWKRAPGPSRATSPDPSVTPRGRSTGTRGT